MPIISKENISLLNKQHNLNLNPEKMYIQSFLINDEQNQASDPVPFKIHPKALSNIVLSAKGRAWLPFPQTDGNHHKPSPSATTEEMLQHQKKYTGGEIVATFINPKTNNGNVIIEVFPEYQKAVRNGDIPPYVSPMINNWSTDENGEIIQGEIVHLQSVHSSGYNPKFAKINGVCEGKDLTSCMAQMRPLAAAGKLTEWRHKGCPPCSQTLNNRTPLGSSSMALDPTNPLMMQDTNIPSPPQPQGQDNGMMMGKMMAELEGMKTAMEGINTQLKEQGETIALIKTHTGMDKPAEPAAEETPVAAEGDENVEGVQELSDKLTDPAEEKEKKPLGAAGQKLQIDYSKLPPQTIQYLKQLERSANQANKKVNELLEQNEAKEIDRLATERLGYANVIASAEIKNNIYSPEQLEERKEYWSTLKNEDGTLKDIDVVADVYKIMKSPNDMPTQPQTEGDMVESPLGASGLYIDNQTPFDDNSFNPSTYMQDLLKTRGKGF